MELPFKNRCPKSAIPFCKNAFWLRLTAAPPAILPYPNCVALFPVVPSIVPDIAVIAWDRIRLSETGEPEDDFTAAPDWIIEILSPGQRVSRVIDNILHCLKHGSKLGWMVDLDDYSILVFAPQQEPEICRADRQLKVIDGIQLALTPQQIFVLQYTTPAAWP